MKWNPPRHRAAFSLIELLVVIAILGALASIAAYAIFRTSGTQQQKATERTLAKLHSIMMAQWKAELDNAREPGAEKAFTDLANGLDNRARVLRTKIGVRSSFPQTFAEARANYGIPPKQAYIQALAGATSDTPELEGAACIFLALGMNRRGQMSNLEDAVGAGGMKDVTIGGKPLKVFVDNWGTPISFYRWSMTPHSAVTTELDALGKADPKSGSIDPMDPEGFLFPTQFSGPRATQALPLVGHSFAAPGHNWQPFLISAGPDKRFNTNDDIYSFRVRE